MPIAIVFPGQGSQFQGMLSEAGERWPVVRKTFDEASETLQYDLWEVCQNAPEENLNRTDITQPALLAAGIALWRVWREKGGPDPAFLAGHSLGEYAALVVAGCVGFCDAVDLVRIRGEAMQSAVAPGEGAMAAVLGLDDDQVIAICQEHVAEGVVEAVNFNAPGQVVIAGARAAVEAVSLACRDAGAKRVMPLDVSVPSHCTLMQPAADRMAGALAGCSISDATIPVVQNVSAVAVTEASVIRENLYWQLISPVRWTESIRFMMEQDVGTLVECGPGKVLSGVVRRIDRKLESFPTETPAQMEAALEGCQ